VSAVYYLIERGTYSPTIRTVVTLVGGLKVTPSKIVVRMEQLLSTILQNVQDQP
jgi:hypothetical protein